MTSKGHKNKTYSLEVWDETTIYLGIEKKIGDKAKTVENEIVDFTGLLQKDGSGWSKEQRLVITTDCCRIDEIWSKKITKTGLHTVILPVIKTDEFPLTIFVAGNICNRLKIILLVAFYLIIPFYHINIILLIYFRTF